MALLSGLNSVAKGTTTPLTLDKPTLYALPSVSGDPYFSVGAHAQSLKITYKSTVGNQTKTVIFDMTQTTPTAGITFSSRARNEYSLTNIFIYDFDGGYFSVDPTDIPNDLNILFT